LFSCCCFFFLLLFFFFFSSRRRHTRSTRDWSSDVCSSDLLQSARSRCRCVLVSVSFADPEPHADRRGARDWCRREGRPPRLRPGEPAQVHPRRVAHEMTGRIRTKKILLASLRLPR